MARLNNRGHKALCAFLYFDVAWLIAIAYALMNMGFNLPSIPDTRLWYPHGVQNPKSAFSSTVAWPYQLRDDRYLYGFDW